LNRASLRDARQIPGRSLRPPTLRNSTTNSVFMSRDRQAHTSVRGLRETERVPIRSSASLIPVASKSRRQSNHDRQERPPPSTELAISKSERRLGDGALTKIGTWRLVKAKWSVGSFRIRTRTAVARTRHSPVITVVNVIATLEKRSVCDASRAFLMLLRR
jgi:hypothetical protein